ncbi:helicase associated domain-containing protein [Pseudarthrobacter sp. NPDC058196]|uniref:helicase associated domain-containing protein n=1 Tax=Pseudarthrobacter sp. NPDC058196 TaxID=3346376 RepID=UPI0036D777B4
MPGSRSCRVSGPAPQGGRRRVPLTRLRPYPRHDSGWPDQPTKHDADEARWAHRLEEVAAYLAARRDWPLHNKTDDQEERSLGIWLHTQRITRRGGKLDESKEARLNDVIPGSQHGRPRRGANSRTQLSVGRS